MTTPNTPNSQIHPIICTRTGVTVASISVLRVAGHVPYLSQWKHTQALHPLFSLQPTELLNFSKSVWAYFCNLSPEQEATPAVTDKQEMLLRISALAMLHHLAEVEQSTVWIPTLQEVYTNWTSLLQLSYWKNYLESNRFKFPDLRISRNNKGIDLTAYMQDCWAVKKAYETRVREAEEIEKIKAAELTLKAIKDEVGGKTPRSKKLLWRWFIAHVPSRYERDIEGWMWELFDAETESEISEFTIADIDLFEEIFLCEVPTGSSISSVFLSRIQQKRKLLETKFKTFEILIPESIAAGVADGSIGEAEPVATDFPKRVHFIIAHAKWKLAHTDTSKHLNAAKARQETVTVSPTHVPDFAAYFERDDEEETVPEITGFELLTGDTPTTGETEE